MVQFPSKCKHLFGQAFRRCFTHDVSIVLSEITSCSGQFCLHVVSFIGIVSGRIIIRPFIIRLTCFLFRSLQFLFGLSLLHLNNLDIEWKCQDRGDASELVQFYGNELSIGAKAARLHLRCPDSCMLENINTSAPLFLTPSTSSTYFFRSLGSLALNRTVRLWSNRDII